MGNWKREVGGWRSPRTNALDTVLCHRDRRSTREERIRSTLYNRLPFVNTHPPIVYHHPSAAHPHRYAPDKSREWRVHPGAPILCEFLQFHNVP